MILHDSNVSNCLQKVDEVTDKVHICANRPKARDILGELN